MARTAGRDGPTPRQAEIVSLVGEGLGDKEIARRLGISPNTVRTHLQRLYRDQEVTNRAAAAMRFAASRPERGPLRYGWRGRGGGLLAVVVVGICAAAGLAVDAGLPAFHGAAAPAPTPAAATGAVAAASPATSELVPSSPTAASHQPPPSAEAATATPAPAPTPRSALTASSSAPPVVAALAAPAGLSADDLARAELYQINAARASAGLPPLVWDDCLAAAAAGAAAKAAAAGFTSPDPGFPDPCRPGLAASVGAYWPALDDAAATRVLLADPVRAALILGPRSRMGAAWATGSTADFLVIEID